MADLTREFELIFSGNKTDLDDTLTGVSRNIDGFTSKVESVAEPLSQITDGILNMDAALAALVLGGLTLAIKKGGEFGDQFGEIATLVDLPRKSLDGFSQNLLAYSRDSSKSIEDINAAVYTAISAGTDYKDSLALLSQTEKLSIAGRADLEATTRLVASTLNAYGASVDQAGKYSDIFFTTVKLGQTTIPELAQKMADVTGIAAGAKIPIETLSAAIAALTATGAPTSQAITSIKAAISNIIKPSSEAEEMAAKLGLKFDASALAAKGFDGILADVKRATGGNVEEMGKLFGSTEALNAALVLSTDTSGKFKDALAAMAASGGATAIAWAKVKDDFSNTNQQIANNVSATLIGLGLRLEDEYGQVAGGVLGVLKGIGTEVDKGTFDPLINLVEKFGIDLGRLLNGIAKAMPEAFAQVDFFGLLDALGDIDESLGDLFGNLDLTDPKDLAKAIQGVIDTVESLTRITGGMAESFKPFFEAIKEGIDHVNNLDAAELEAIGNLLIAAKLITTFGLEVAAALAAIEQSGIGMGRAFDLVFGGVKFTINTLQTAFDSIVLGIGSGIERLLTYANAASFGQIDGLAEAVTSIREFNAAVEQHRNEQVAEMAKGWDQVAGNVERTGTAIMEIPAEVKTNLTGTVDAALVDWAAKANDGFSAEVSVGVNSTSAAQAKTDLAAVGGAAYFDHDSNTWHNAVVIAPEVDTSAAATARKKLDDEFSLKTLEMETTFNVAKLETQAATVQKAMEFKASVDIAELEANVKNMETLGRGVEAIWSSTGDTISSLFNQFANLDTSSATIREWVDKLHGKENALREKGLELQERSLEMQEKITSAKLARMNSGQALFSIDGSSLGPHIEAFMFEILSQIQLRVNASGDEFLVGVGQ